jgi:hypothetical protein
MQFFSIKRAIVTLGAVAALAVGTGIVPSLTGHTTTAQAAELAQHHGGHGGPNFHGGHGGFHGRNFRAAHGFSHQYWGWGFHRTYPQYYVAYYYEPVEVCSTYYFDEGVYYCFTGY